MMLVKRPVKELRALLIAPQNKIGRDKSGIASEFISQNAGGSFGKGNLNKPTYLAVVIRWDEVVA